MLEDGHQQTPFGRVALVESMVASASSTGGFISSRDVQDSVGVDIAGDLDHGRLTSLPLSSDFGSCSH